MIRYALNRLATAIPTLLGVLLVTFALLYAMPGDPIAHLVSAANGITPREMQELRGRFGLNDPMPVQFVHYVGHVVHGDLGTSILSNRSVGSLIVEALPNTIELALAALAISIMIGIPLGVIAAIRHRTWVDHVSIGASLLGVSMPEFWAAMLAILIFSVNLQWFPAFGADGLSALVLPAAVLGIRTSATLARVTRSSMLEVLGRQYVTTARAKGLSEWAVVMLHALKNALIPVVTLLGLQLGYLLAGAVVVETIFARPGIGSLLINAVLNKDVPVLRGTILVVAVGYVLVNLLVDLSYGWLDPRIRSARRSAA